MENECGNCKEKQWSVMDKNYLALFGICWSCDKKNWESGVLSLGAFERKEKKALEFNNNP